MNRCMKCLHVAPCPVCDEGKTDLGAQMVEQIREDMMFVRRHAANALAALQLGDPDIATRHLNRVIAKRPPKVEGGE